MRKKWRCSTCTLCDWIETDHYANNDELVAALQASHRSTSPWGDQVIHDIFGEPNLHVPFTAEVMPYLDCLERDVQNLESIQPEFIDNAHILVLKAGLIAVDNVLGFDAWLLKPESA